MRHNPNAPMNQKKKKTDNSLIAKIQIVTEQNLERIKKYSHEFPHAQKEKISKKILFLTYLNLISHLILHNNQYLNYFINIDNKYSKNGKIETKNSFIIFYNISIPPKIFRIDDLICSHNVSPDIVEFTKNIIVHRNNPERFTLEKIIKQAKIIICSKKKEKYPPIICWQLDEYFNDNIMTRISHIPKENIVSMFGKSHIELHEKYNVENGDVNILFIPNNPQYLNYGNHTQNKYSTYYSDDETIHSDNHSSYKNSPFLEKIDKCLTSSDDVIMHSSMSKILPGKFCNNFKNFDGNNIRTNPTNQSQFAGNKWIMNGDDDSSYSYCDVIGTKNIKNSTNDTYLSEIQMDSIHSDKDNKKNINYSDEEDYTGQCDNEMLSDKYQVYNKYIEQPQNKPIQKEKLHEASGPINNDSTEYVYGSHENSNESISKQSLISQDLQYYTNDLESNLQNQTESNYNDDISESSTSSSISLQIYQNKNDNDLTNSMSNENVEKLIREPIIYEHQQNNKIKKQIPNTIKKKTIMTKQKNLNKKNSYNSGFSEFDNVHNDFFCENFSEINIPEKIIKETISNNIPKNIMEGNNNNTVYKIYNGNNMKMNISSHDNLSSECATESIDEYKRNNYHKYNNVDNSTKNSIENSFDHRFNNGNTNNEVNCIEDRVTNNISNNVVNSNTHNVGNNLGSRKNYSPSFECERFEPEHTNMEEILIKKIEDENGINIFFERVNKFSEKRRILKQKKYHRKGRKIIYDRNHKEKRKKEHEKKNNTVVEKIINAMKVVCDEDIVNNMGKYLNGLDC
jgi:hypothetical protein